MMTNQATVDKSRSRAIHSRHRRRIARLATPSPAAILRIARVFWASVGLPRGLDRGLNFQKFLHRARCQRQDALALLVEHERARAPPEQALQQLRRMVEH